ncbi:MAG: hypothetical protein J1F41_05125 [Lachnospiraceae bacterium]|nr:hypothetical protein [Lachnospiraceae bacterium]
MYCMISEIKKSLYIPFFIISCVGVVFICLLSEGYTSASGKSYTIFELLLSLRRDVMFVDIFLNRYEIWMKGIGVWTQLLLPFLLSIGYLSVVSGEKQKGMNRLLLIRENNLKYSISKVFSAMLSGGIIMFVGYLLFGLVVYAKFPSIQEYSKNDLNRYLEFYQGFHQDFHEVSFCFSRCVDVFLYGMCVNIFAYLVSIFFTDKYILFCLPIMLKYIWGQAVIKIELDAMNKGQETLLNLCAVFRVENILNRNSSVYWVTSLLFIFAVYLLGLHLHMYLLRKRGDGFGLD